MGATRFFLMTFGCKVNQYETQAIREAWCGRGWIEADKASCADIIVINSCAITYTGERDARWALTRLYREAPHARFIVTGCAADLVYQSLADQTLRAQTQCVLQKDKAMLLHDPAMVSKDIYPPFAITAFQRARPIVKIQDGCSHRCTYCIVPTVRSKPLSRPPADIVREARTLLAKGYGELILSGINMKQYGVDHPEYGDMWDIVMLLERELAEEYADRARIRLSSVEPSQLDSRGLAVLEASTLLCPHLHLSLQHTAPQILRLMGRGHYTIEQVANAVSSLSSIWPRFGLGCDVIMGFPGETEEDVAHLLDAIRAMPFTYAHIFPYSPRPNTAAASFPNQVPDKLARERARRVRTLFAEKNRAFRMTLVDKRVPLRVIPEHRSHQGQCKGVCEYYISCFWEGSGEHVGFERVSPCGLHEQGLLVEREKARE